MRLTEHPLRRPWGRLSVWRAGAGPVVLAVHGLGGSGRYWGGLAAALDRDFAVVAPDLAGFGHSDRPQLTYDRSFHLENLDAVAQRAAGNARVIVVGHSMGGTLAALWAARRPDRVAALALVAAPYPASGNTMPRRDQRAKAQDEKRTHQRVYTAFRRAWPVITLPVRSRTFPRAVIADYMRHSLVSYWGTAESVLWDPTTEAELQPLRGIGVPALILSASDDVRVGPCNVDLWSALLRQADREVVKGGHQMLLRTHFAPLALWVQGLPHGGETLPG